MKIFILVLFLFISPIELRLRNDDIYELDDLLKKYDRYNFRPNKPYISDDESVNENENDNDDNDNDGDEYIPSTYQRKKVHPSHKKVLGDDEESENEYLLPKTTLPVDDLSDTSSCFDGYNTQSEQLVKIKELKNGAHLIRFTLIDKRSLSSNHNIKDNCMLECCSQKLCDLAMLSEQPTHEGYKCYLFACNGSCTLASHQDYSVLTPKKDAILYTTVPTTKTSDKSTTTISNVPITYQKKSLFRETSVIIFLIFGIISTIVLFVFIFRHCQASRRHGRKSNKNYSVDADYLINGLYL